jgi:hypothetical protein
LSCFVVAFGLAACELPPQTTEQARSKVYGDALSWDGFQRAHSSLDTLEPGTPLSASGISWMYFDLYKAGQWVESVAVADGWLPQLSGSLWGAGSGLGRLTERDPHHVGGEHVFGYMWAQSMRPGWVVSTRAEIVTQDEHDQLKADRTPDIGWVDVRDTGERIFFRDVRISRVRRLDVEPPPVLSAEEYEVVEVTREESRLFEVYNPESYREAERRLEALAPGADVWDLVHALEGRFYTTGPGGRYALYMMGFANYEAEGRWAVTKRQARYEMWPFGFVENEKQRFETYAIFRNGKLDRVVPYASREEIEASLSP